MPYQLTLPLSKVQPVIDGHQSVMTLDWAEPYLSVFVDKERMMENERLIAEGHPEQCQSVLRGDIWELEITDAEQSYHLQLTFDDYGALRIDRDDLNYLAGSYHYHDLDDEWLFYRRMPYREKPLFFYFHIEKVQML